MTFDTWIFFKWIFKTFCAVLIVTNTWNIVMAVFDVAQNVVNQSAGVIISDAGIDISSVTADLETQLADWSIGALLGLWFQSIFVGLCTQILSICIFLVIYGRMIEVYLVTSIGPIPFATMVNREWGNTGQNYLRSLLALGFQAFLIMICVGIYAVLVESISLSGDNISGAIWGCMGYTVLLCFTLFKTGSLAKSLFGRIEATSRNMSCRDHPEKGETSGVEPVRDYMVTRLVAANVLSDFIGCGINTDMLQRSFWRRNKAIRHFSPVSLLTSRQPRFSGKS